MTSPASARALGAPMSRREARERRATGGSRSAAAATEVDASAISGRRPKVVKVLVITLIVLLLATTWLAVRALIVKNELEASQQLIGQVQDGDIEVSDALEELGGHAGLAASVWWDPVWRAAEFVPFAGDNLRAVRLAAESLDVATNGLGRPVFAEFQQDSDEPVLARALPIISSAAPTIGRLADEIAAVSDSPSLIGPVRGGVEQVAEVMGAAAPMVELLPELLGANGKRNYLLVFQNNAESVGLGGSAASQSLVTAEAGKVAITHQANSDVYANDTPVDVEVPQSALDLYSDFLVKRINTSSSRPDFPTMAKIVSAWWQRDVQNDQIDGVVSVNPIALGRMLRATGPVELSTGDVLTEDNAVQLLLSEVYERWGTQETKKGADKFFSSAAKEIFAKLSTGAFNPKDMAWAVGEGIEAGDIMFYSAHEDVQEAVAPLKLSGILPSDNEDQTTLGVYFRNESASKIDYYTRSAVDVTESCTDGRRTFTTATSLHLDIDQAAANLLPDYVRSQTWDSAFFRTAVFVYGPPGTQVDSVSVDGREVSVMREDLEDLGRPVAWFHVYLRPSEQASVTATFSGADGDYGPLEVRTTPMINETEVATSSDGCAAR
ncbi:DUF4012 domain-containing protein [Microbacterium sp. JZ31]|uniref:DUF4012 domain-containing protein n=1 Tax=Microbacterium sp. JZ31 TaxID=1906274 RepID=UPI0019311F86|nr:DUF4012 domain-containing protein [Microbacterium sp. JZ31]